MSSIHLKLPKEQRLQNGITVELFATNSFLCPVTAFNNYVRDCPFFLADDKPVFQTMDVKGYTRKMFNADLKVLLHGHVDYKDGKITSHSFRAGLATELAKLGGIDFFLVLVWFLVVCFLLVWFLLVWFL